MNLSVKEINAHGEGGEEERWRDEIKRADRGRRKPARNLVACNSLKIPAVRAGQGAEGTFDVPLSCSELFQDESGVECGCAQFEITVRDYRLTAL